MCPNDGTFDVYGLPRESISVSLSIPGHRFSEKNKSLDRLNGGNIVGRVDSDTSVEILLEPGNFQRPDFSKPLQIKNPYPENEPIEGVTPITL